jgi:membrane protease subunit HflK
MYLDSMQQIYSNVTKVVVESRQGFSLLYLPLDKILQMGGGSGIQADAAQILPPGTTALPASPSSNSNSSDARTRDAARTRERDVR